MNPKENKMARIFLKLFRVVANLQFQLSSLRQILDINSHTLKIYLDLIELADARAKKMQEEIEEMKTVLMLKDAELDGLRAKFDIHETEINSLQGGYAELSKKVKSIG